MPKLKSICIESIEAAGYQISPLGILYRNNKEIAGTVNKGGYRVVRLIVPNATGNYMMHRLVAHKYLEPIPGKLIVNHKDFDKLNNNVSNLEWTDMLGNTHHAFGILDDTKDKARELSSMGFKQAQIAETLGVNPATVYRWLSPTVDRLKLTID
ncbi:HNH endonuclease [Pantoea phage Nufs112]|nr:HNH endonuclease [Pantoea phage Nufs112]